MFNNFQIVESFFCNKCQTPKPLFNGVVEVKENIAYYYCQAGFELNDQKYINGRKCSKAAKWEGLYEPYCKRIFCGYPGFVRNSYQTGTSYYFQDKVMYHCHEGFRIIGDNVITCELHGVWVPNKPHCLDLVLGTQCNAFKRPSHSEINIFTDEPFFSSLKNKTTFEIGTQIEIICHSDREIFGENILTCTEN
ncbi:hypothetical protein NQ315_014859, partial [Exocentrus adspersus]